MSNAKQAHHRADPNCMTRDGKVCQFKPRGLNIVWGNDSRYWKIPEVGSSRNAELIQVSWLEVSGVVNDVERGKKYRIEFDVKVKEDGFGWNGTKVLVMVKVGRRGKYNPKQVFLSPGSDRKIPTDEESSGPLEIVVPPNAPDNTLYFGLYEVWSGKWKGGLEIKGAKVTET